MTATLHIPDVSEFQSDVDWAKVNEWNGGHAIVRAAYGARHTDKAWYGGARRKDFWAKGGQSLGIYQYFVADQDARAQARALAALIGKLRPGEYLICDDEEGSGDQAPRFRMWTNELRGLTYPGYLGHWLYSGDYFAKEHGLTGVFDSPKHTWLAAYQSHEPTDLPHTLWQYTDTAVVPGIGPHVDCSVFHGTGAQFLALIGHVTTPTKPSPAHHPAVRHPFAELTLDGEAGPITCHALNYWLGTLNQGSHWTRITTRALQHRVNAMVTGVVSPNTLIGLHRYLSHWYPMLDSTVLDPATIRQLQAYLNTNVGGY